MGLDAHKGPGQVTQGHGSEEQQPPEALHICPVVSSPEDRLEVHDNGSRSLSAWDEVLIVGRCNHLSPLW